MAAATVYYLPFEELWVTFLLLATASHEDVQIIKHRFLSLFSTVSNTVATTRDKVAHPINIIWSPFYQSSCTVRHYAMHVVNSQALPQYLLCKLTVFNCLFFKDSY